RSVARVVAVSRPLARACRFDARADPGRTLARRARREPLDAHRRDLHVQIDAVGEGAGETGAVAKYVGRCTRDGDEAVLHRLAQRLEHRAGKLEELVEKEDAVMRQAHLTGTRRRASA